MAAYRPPRQPAASKQITMFAPEKAFGATCKAPKTLGIATPFTLYVFVPDVDAVYQQALAASRISRMGPDNMFRGERYCRA